MTEAKLALTEEMIEVDFLYEDEIGNTVIKLKGDLEHLGLWGTGKFKMPDKYKEFTNEKTAYSISYMRALIALLEDGAKSDCEDFAMECKLSLPDLIKEEKMFVDGKYDMYKRLQRLRRNGKPEQARMVHLNKEGEVTNIG